MLLNHAPQCGHLFGEISYVAPISLGEPHITPTLCRPSISCQIIFKHFVQTGINIIDAISLFIIIPHFSFKSSFALPISTEPIVLMSCAILFTKHISFPSTIRNNFFISMLAILAPDKFLHITVSSAKLCLFICACFHNKLTHSHFTDLPIQQ